MRNGFTTGSAAAAASKAACIMLFSGKEKRDTTIITPYKKFYSAKIVDILRSKDEVSCAVIKDGGDDPDVTTGAHITAKVSLFESDSFTVLIDGGVGVGRVTKPGLDQPVGNVAINHVPREMIAKEISEVAQIYDYTGGVKVIISVPGGEEIAKKTFNPRLGIEGGISIIGTSGIVEPMSEKALTDTIRVELRQKREMGADIAAVSPGNYGLDFMKRTYNYDLDKSVKCSNFIGDTIDMAIELGFTSMLITGHIGKLIKVAGGMMNTHSRMGDCRMEILAAAAIRAGASHNTLVKILDSVTTEEGAVLLKEEGKLDAAMDYILTKVMYFLDKKADGKIKIECMLYSNQLGLLARSEGAEEMLKSLQMTD